MAEISAAKTTGYLVSKIAENKRDLIYPHIPWRDFRGRQLTFLSFQENIRIVHNLGHESFLANPFQFIVYTAIQHLTDAILKAVLYNQQEKWNSKCLFRKNLQNKCNRKLSSCCQVVSCVQMVELTERTNTRMRLRTHQGHFTYISSVYLSVDVLRLSWRFVTYVTCYSNKSQQS